MPVERPRYRKISIRMWGDDKFCQLSKPQPNGQSLWFYLLTGPHTTAVPGLFSMGEAGLAEGAGWSLKDFRKVFGEVSRKGLVHAQWTHRVVFIPNAVKHNAPENPNVVTSWRSAFDEIPDCALKLFAYQRIEGFLKGFSEGFPKAWLPVYAKVFPEAVEDGFPKQEQEQEQEQKQEQRRAPDRGASYLDERLRIPDFLDDDLARMHPTFNRIDFYQALSRRLGEEPQDQSDLNAFCRWVKDEFRKAADLPPLEIATRGMLSTRDRYADLRGTLAKGKAS